MRISTKENRVTVHFIFQGAKFPDKYDSGLLSMMFANALLEGKLLSVKQVKLK